MAIRTFQRVCVTDFCGFVSLGSSPIKYKSIGQMAGAQADDKVVLTRIEKHTEVGYLLEKR